MLFGKVLAAVLYALLLSLAGLLVALATVYVAQPQASGHVYSWQVGLAAVVLSLLTALLWSALGVLASLRASTVRQAQQRLSIGTMVVFLLPAFAAGALRASLRSALSGALAGGIGSIATTAAIALFVLDVVLLLAARAGFNRARLIW